MGGPDAAVALASSVKERAGSRDRLDDTLPVASALREVLPTAGLRRGSTVSVATAAGGTSLLMALVAEASRTGRWCAAVGMPQLGAVSAAEMGIALDRLVVVPRPGRSWPTVAAALLEGVDVVVLRPLARPAGREMRRLTARARERRAVLIAAGPWEGAELRLTVTASRWHGVGAGDGHLRARELRMRVEGRGAAARPRETTLWLSAPQAGTSAVSVRPWHGGHGLTDTEGGVPGAPPAAGIRVVAA